MAHTGAVFEKPDGVLTGSMLIRCCNSRVREHSTHVLRIREADQLGESCVQRRHQDPHGPLGKIRHELPEGCRQATAYRLGLYLGKSDRFFVPIFVCICSPGYSDRANVILAALCVHKRVVIGNDPTVRFESCLP